MSEKRLQPEFHTSEPRYQIGAWILDGPRGGWPSLDGKSSEDEEKRFQAALVSIDDASSQSLDSEPTDDYIQRFQAALDSFDEIIPPDRS